MNQIPKILFFIPVWKRLHIAKMCYEGLQRFIRNAQDKINAQVLIIYSEDEHGQLADKYGFPKFRASNEYVGHKFNKGMEYALGMDWDYAWQINSDTLMDDALLDVFLSAIQEGQPFASIEKLYLVDTLTGRAKEFHYTLNGCGIRIIRRDWVIDSGYQYYCEVGRSAKGPYATFRKGQQLYLPQRTTQKAFIKPINNKKVFRLWEPQAMRGMDNYSRNQMFLAFGEPAGWIRTTPRPYVIDLKSATNIWSYEQLDGKELTHSQRQALNVRFPELQTLMINPNVIE